MINDNMGDAKTVINVKYIVENEEGQMFIKDCKVCFKKIKLSKISH